MRSGGRAILVGLVGILLAQGCGSSSGGSAGRADGTLSFRAKWQQSTTGGSAAAGDGAFGPTIPRAAKSVVVVFDPSVGGRRCIAVDPLAVPIDPVVGQRVLILRGLPAGPASITLFGFATEPDRAREVCEGTRLGTPSFRSDPHAVTIVPAQHNDAGDIKVYALPFLVDLRPAAELPPAVFGDSNGRVIVADAATGIRPDSVSVQFRSGNPPGQTIATTLSAEACADGTDVPCSPSGDLAVTGLVVTWTPDSLPAGPGHIEVLASNLDTPVRTLDFSYEVIVPPTINPGALTGTVINCLTGAPLAATVTLVEPEAREVAAGSDGRFGFSALPLGGFRVRAVTNGFNASEISGTLTAANPTQNLTVPLCPPIAMRTVLTWGSGSPAPPDLDAHLRGPAPGTLVSDAPVEFHLFFTNRSITFPTGGRATLDLDSRNFSGPETDSVTELAPGMYHYCVHDFSNRADPASAGLARSGARVQVFLNDQQVGEFPAPDGIGNVWEVFQFDTTRQPPQLLPVNQLGAELLSERVCHGANDPDGDGLTNDQENELGTDPSLPDTNGNGISDGQDVINGTDPLPPRTPTPTATTPPLPPTPTPTPTVCPMGASGSIVVFSDLRVGGTDDPTITLINTGNNILDARCFYADANMRCGGSGQVCSNTSECQVGTVCAPGCRIDGFSIQLAPLSSVQWRPSRGAVGIPPVPETPFVGELTCVEVDASEVPVGANRLLGTVGNGVQCPVAGTSILGFGNGNLDNTLCLGGVETPQCPNGAEYDPCPAGTDAMRIQSCWSQSQFVFSCGAAI